jgi:hypothetical protein
MQSCWLVGVIVSAATVGVGGCVACCHGCHAPPTHMLSCVAGSWVGTALSTVLTCERHTHKVGGLLGGSSHSQDRPFWLIRCCWGCCCGCSPTVVGRHGGQRRGRPADCCQPAAALQRGLSDEVPNEGENHTPLCWLVCVYVLLGFHLEIWLAPAVAVAATASQQGCWLGVFKEGQRGRCQHSL